MPSLFIVFEGGEGAGKTTAMAHAAAALGDQAIVTREPGGTPEGLALRALLLAGDAPQWDPIAELLLMVAARVQHVTRVVKPALARGKVVLCDRFLGSTLAYQGAGRGLDENFILDLHRRSVGLMPDFTVLLDVDPRIGLRRSARRLAASGQDEGRFEALDLAFHERVRASFPGAGEDRALRCYRCRFAGGGRQSRRAERGSSNVAGMTQPSSPGKLWLAVSLSYRACMRLTCWQERKQSFIEKKDQKAFVSSPARQPTLVLQGLGLAEPMRALLQADSKSFLVLFLEKGLLACFASMNQPQGGWVSADYCSASEGTVIGARQKCSASFLKERRSPVFVACGAVLLTACSPGATPPEVQACTTEKLADLPMAPGIARPVVDARLDGQLVPMLLNTGGERLSVYKSAAIALRLPEDKLHRSTTIGIGGAQTTFDVILQHFELGGVELLQSRASVSERSAVPVMRSPPAGEIGAQTLAAYDVEFDFIRRHVVLWQVSGCAQVAPAWEGAWSYARLARGPSNLVSLDVSINGHAVRALLDTGERNTTIDIDTAGNLGISSAALAASREVVTRGADGHDVVAHTVPVGDLAIGSLHFKNGEIVVSPIHLHNAGMLLGVDFLQHHDVWVSYAGQKLFVR